MTSTPHRPDLPPDQPGEPVPVEPQPTQPAETEESDDDGRARRRLDEQRDQS